GGVERVDGTKRLHGWEQPQYDDSAWQHAVAFAGTVDVNGVLNPWRLTPRPIPHLTEIDRRFERVVRANQWPDSLDGRPSELPPHAHCWIELDAGELTTGYVSLHLQG